VIRWKYDALCITDPGGHWDGDLLPSMWRMCSRCPVIEQCFHEGMSHDYRDDVGVWGGTTVEQRNRIRRRQATFDEVQEENGRVFA
jgi:hypothetical protein